MKLKDFPLVMRAFKEIELGNGATRARTLKGETEVEAFWLAPFRCAEDCFEMCGDKTVDFVPALSGKEEYDVHTPLWQVVCMSVNDDAEIALRGVGRTELEVWVTNRLLYEFFDGDLAGAFTEKRRI